MFGGLDPYGEQIRLNIGTNWVKPDKLIRRTSDNKCCITAKLMWKEIENQPIPLGLKHTFIVFKDINDPKPNHTAVGAYGTKDRGTGTKARPYGELAPKYNAQNDTAAYDLSHPQGFNAEGEAIKFKDGSDACTFLECVEKKMAQPNYGIYDPVSNSSNTFIQMLLVDCGATNTMPLGAPTDEAGAKLAILAGLMKWEIRKHRLLNSLPDDWKPGIGDLPKFAKLAAEAMEKLMTQPGGTGGVRRPDPPVTQPLTQIAPEAE